MPENRIAERVLIIAPVGQDAKAMADLLQRHGFEPAICPEVQQACQQILAGAGVLIITDEVLELPGFFSLLDILGAQPPWSKLPVILLTSHGGTDFSRLLDSATIAAGSISWLERPLGSGTLLRSVEVALHTRRRQYQLRDLLADKARLAAIVETSEVAIMTISLPTWNRGAEHLFGYTAPEAIGRPISMLIPDERRGEEIELLNRIRRGQSSEYSETVRRCKDGSLLNISLTVSPITDTMGKVTSASEIARDTTARKKTENELLEAQERLRNHASNLERLVKERTVDLRDTNEQLEAFVYSVAHDLRAPLRAMSGFSQILRQDYAAKLDEQGADLLERIQHSAAFMDRLLLDLLDYGRMSHAEIDFQPVLLKNTWDIALAQFQEQIKKSGANIETVEPLPRVLAHESTLGQCFANLLGNALKFVVHGEQPHVRFWAEEHDKAVRVWVEDNGVGIPVGQQERAFRVFERLHGTRYPGTGIGLSIVRKGIEAMGGKVGVISEPHRGSRFWIELPKAPEPA